MADYDIQTYLLDRANIHDVVTKMYLYPDMSKFSQVGKEVFAETVVVDYTAMFGGEPVEISGEDQARKWERQLGGLDAWQHVTSSILIELPQPGKGVQLLQKAKVVANVNAYLKRVAAKGDPETRNGGRFIGELIREAREGNPWRVSLFKADFIWASGNWDVLANAARDA